MGIPHRMKLLIPALALAMAVPAFSAEEKPAQIPGVAFVRKAEIGRAHV